MADNNSNPPKLTDSIRRRLVESKRKLENIQISLAKLESMGHSKRRAHAIADLIEAGNKHAAFIAKPVWASLRSAPAPDASADALDTASAHAFIHGKTKKQKRLKRKRKQQRADAKKQDYDQAWWDKYHAYLSSTEWFAFRKRTIGAAAGQCEKCASP